MDGPADRANHQMKYFSLLILALAVASGCRTKGPMFNAYAPEGDTNETFSAIHLTNSVDTALLKPPVDPYRLGPGDVIDIETIGESASRISLTVGPDGKIYYSLLAGTSVWGLTLAETRALLQKEMAKFTRGAPELVINLRTVASQRVWLLGAVGAPGAYALGTPTTLLDIVAASGGLAAAAGTVGTVGAAGNSPEDAADLTRSFVLRNGKPLPVDFERLLRGDLSQNIYLAPDDFVFVRPADVPSVYVLGAVAAPIVLPYTRDISVAEAVLKAGGPLRYAQQNRIVILRGGLTQPRLAQIDYHSIVKGKTRNVRLEPGDIVYVSHAPFYRVAQLAEEILDQFVRTIAVNEGVRAIDNSKPPVGISSAYGSGITPAGK
jgi:polysaccharide biosynthesis/export protein